MRAEVSPGHGNPKGIQPITSQLSHRSYLNFVNEAVRKLLGVSELAGERGGFKATEAKRVKGAFRHLNATATEEGSPRQQHYVNFIRRLKEVAGAAMVALSAAGLGQAAVYSMTDRVRTELPFKILEDKGDLQNAVIEAIATKYASSTEPCPGQLVHVAGHISSVLWTSCLPSYFERRQGTFEES
ncbi:hypothetical protein CBS147339_9179 [Penicillium roqueforti]|nr:hypothetical protein LCP963914a_7238 [Penicillium roqueforti]KAI2683451.1 hypothetical protein CBS147355_2591 [Penicillium roqueforti]KAI3065213.1 hypothetical protein CBS147339_9179 [Penicillium roqueforti]KAI3093134.1 hypothetical protein CBS147338_7290 [Penicillium roqueforti]KAI3105065.1 hypothetical protein CBS147333_7044 [Penicillium roqueforti]